MAKRASTKRAEVLESLSAKIKLEEDYQIDVPLIEQALRYMGIVYDTHKNAFGYGKRAASQAVNVPLQTLEDDEVTAHILDYVFSNFPQQYNPEMGTDTFEITDMQQWQGRRDAKRGKLALAMQRDTYDDAKKMLGTYLTFLEENPRMHFPGKEQPEVRTQFIDDLFAGPVDTEGRRFVFHYLDMIEQCADANEEIASLVAAHTIALYGALPHVGVQQFVADGLQKVAAYKIASFPSCRDIYQQWETIKSYFGLASEEAKSALNAVASSLYKKLQQDYRSLEKEHQGLVGKVASLEQQNVQLASSKQVELEKKEEYHEKKLALDVELENVKAELKTVSEKESNLRKDLDSQKKTVEDYSLQKGQLALEQEQLRGHNGSLSKKLKRRTIAAAMLGVLSLGSIGYHFYSMHRERQEHQVLQRKYDLLLGDCGRGDFDSDRN